MPYCKYKTYLFSASINKVILPVTITSNNIILATDLFWKLQYHVSFRVYKNIYSLLNLVEKVNSASCSNASTLALLAFSLHTHTTERKAINKVQASIMGYEAITF